MVLKRTCAVVLLFPLLCAGLDRGSDCVTPNGEYAKCIAVTSCKIIRDAIATKNITLLDFVRKSQCGFDTEPLVCCGTVAYTSPRGSNCTTPDGEAAKCKAMSQCKALGIRLQNRDKATIEFEKQSQCGYDIEPLVCCGLEKTASAVSSFFPDRTVCGSEKDENRVIGGELADLDDHPWMALLRYKVTATGVDDGFKCGGTLINQRYVLTAAHCVIISTNEFELFSVRLGEWRISTAEDCAIGVVNDECTAPVVDVEIETEIPHEGYSRKQGKHDIALLRLKRNVAITDYVRPVCLRLPEAPEASESTKLTVAGWGQTENSSQSDVKLTAQLPVVSRSLCSQKVHQRGAIDEYKICAGGEKGRDSCLGDSGGPLMGKFDDVDDKKKQQWYQEAIVSYGVHCGIEGIPAVYTRVSKYIDWMVKNMKPF